MSVESCQPADSHMAVLCLEPYGGRNGTETPAAAVLRHRSRHWIADGVVAPPTTVPGGGSVAGTVSVGVGRHRDHDLAGLGTALLDVCHCLERLVEREGAVDDRAELPAVVEGA
jgi:hypothetical protein